MNLFSARFLCAIVTWRNFASFSGSMSIVLGIDFSPMPLNCGVYLYRGVSAMSSVRPPFPRSPSRGNRSGSPLRRLATFYGGFYGSFCDGTSVFACSSC